MHKFLSCHISEYKSDSAMIQAAVDQAALTGETVTIPRMNPRTGEPVWVFEEAVKLYSGSVICLDNCIIRGGAELFDNLFKNSNARTEFALTEEGQQKDICIYGLGNAVLDGGVPIPFSEKTWKPGDPFIFSVSPIHFHNVTGFSIKNIKITNQRYWGIVCHFCTDGVIQGIRFDTEGRSINQDGIDLRIGCKDILIEDISGTVGDDMVALTALYGGERSLAVEGMSIDICNVIIRNIRGKALDYKGFIRVLNHGGARIHEVLIEDIMDISDASVPAHRFGSAVRIGENAYFINGEQAQPGDTYNITVRNVVTAARTGVYISCTLYDSLIDNIRMRDQGGTAVYFQKGVMKNISVSNINYAHNCIHPDTDANQAENYYNTKKAAPDIPVEARRVCAVYAKEADLEDILIETLHVRGNLTAVFGGSGIGALQYRDLKVKGDIPLGAMEQVEVCRR